MEQINWYKIFYYVSMSDGIKHFFDIFSNWFTFFSIISGIGMFISYLIINATKNYEQDDRFGYMKTVYKPISIFFYTSITLCLLTWFGYVALPDKKDSMLIIAGGAVGNFITSDSSAKQLPSEVLLLLRYKIKSEILDLKTESVKDTLAGMSKEELIKTIRNSK